MTDETRILLVRHGQSEWNASGRWQGQADPPLTSHGRLQAREAAEALGALDAVWASDLRRASETALTIADVLGVGPVVLDEDLRERDAGEWSGLTRDEIDERYPGYLAEGRRPPGWESDEDLLARGLRVLVRIATELPGGDVVAVTHGGLIYVLEQHLGAAFARIGNVEGRWVAVAGESLRLGERVQLAAPEDVTVPRQI
ncbi:MAG TPA: histidine phosphatase family protein [Acidimicrobiales bacterium]|nr:histidine phosphatase family protein [Acidimicrobiales bacterium]